MNSITFNPEQVLHYVGLPMLWIGVILFGYFFVRFEKILNRNAVGFPALALIVIGMVSWGVADSLTSDRIFAEKLATLPIEWQEFYAELGELNDSSLMREAVNRFALSHPPEITAEQYSTLNSRRSAFDNSHVRACVNLDFAEGKK